MASTFYVPPPGEYSDPSGLYHFELPLDSSFDNHFVRGTVYHQPALKGFSDGEVFVAALVPEPGNPHDPWALAIHLGGQRIGYIAGDYAVWMHEYVAAHNRRDKEVTVDGAIRVDGRDIKATVFMPWPHHQQQFRNDSGLPAECRALLSVLPDEVLQRAMQTSQNLSQSDAKWIRRLEPGAGQLIWVDRPKTRIPEPLHRALVTMDHERKAEIRRTRDAARVEKQREEAARRKAKLEATEARDGAILAMAAAGATQTAIARELGCSDSTVRSTMAAAGNKSLTNSNTASQDERLERGRRALGLQRAGITRRAIAEELECGPDTVKSLLKDAKFFEDPASDQVRLDRAVAVRAADSCLKLEAAGTQLGWTVRAVKAARSDAVMLGRRG